MKRSLILVFILMLSLLLNLTACGDKITDETKDENDKNVLEETMKIGLFTDPHYYTDTNKETGGESLAQKKIKEAMEYFLAAEVDMILCLGDLTDSENQDGSEPDPLGKIMEVIDTYDIPFYCVPGNHDYLHYDVETFLEKSHTPELPCLIDTPTHTLILLDGNYRSDMRRYDVAGVDWTDSNLIPEHVAFLKDALENSEKPCIIFVHQNLDFNVGWKPCIIKNAAEVRELLEASGKVPLVIQGHFHLGADNVIGGIRYYTIEGMYDNEGNRVCILELSDKGCSIEKIEFSR